MPVSGRPAGGSSQRKYNELVRSWRRRNRKSFVIVAVTCGGLAALSFVGAQRFPAHAWTLGMLAGAALSFWVIARISPPGWIENWQSGSWGEEATAKVLRPLEKEGWIVLHDLPAGRGNVDHIAIGPAGVFLLDSKRLGGSVIVDEAGLLVRRLDAPDLSYRHPGSPHLRNLARKTHDRVLATTRLKIWVTPVMVLWAEFPQRVARDRCVFVHGDELRSWLQSQPNTIAPTRIPQIADAVHRAWFTGDERE